MIGVVGSASSGSWVELAETGTVESTPNGALQSSVGGNLFSDHSGTLHYEI